MSDATPLDTAHARMQSAADDDAARLGFYARLAEAELFVLLEREAEGASISPRVFPVEGARYVLVFDREERLAEFVGAVAPFAALSGRRLAKMLAGHALGLGLNLGVAPSSILIPPTAVDWLAETVSHGPEAHVARPHEFLPPAGLPEALLSALDAKLAQAAGLAKSACLAEVHYEGGGRGHMLAFIDALPEAESALTQAVGEALTFSGIEAGALDVAFLAAGDPAFARLASVSLRFDLPKPAQVRQSKPIPPGSDPEHPPILR